MPTKKKMSEKTDKRYRAKITIPNLDKPIYVSAKTKAELESKKKAVKEEYISGKKRQDIPFVALIEEWWNLIKRPSIKTSASLRGWKVILNAHILPYFSEKKMTRAITRKDLQACLDKADSMNESTPMLIRSCLKNVCKYAMSEGLMTVDQSLVLINPKTVPRRERQPFTRIEEEKIISTAERLGGSAEMFIKLLYYLGVRKGEALGLQWSDILWKKKLVHVWRDVDASTNPEVIGELKTKAADRYIPIPSPFLKFLNAKRSMPDIYLVTGGSTFCTNVQADYLLRKVMYHSNLFEYKPGKKSAPTFTNLRNDIIPRFTAHNFRHHYVTSRVQAEDKPEFIKTIVGHASYQTTIDIYTHVQKQMLEDDFKPSKLSEIFRFDREVAEKLPKTVQHT